MPVRIQRKRTKGWRMPPNAVYVGRPSRWGNPFVHRGQWGLVRTGPEHLARFGRGWDHEGRISRAGRRHDMRVGPGDVVETHVRRATPAELVELYRLTLVAPTLAMIDAYPSRGGHFVRASIEDIRRELAGRDLCCWCPVSEPCHADVLLELANAPGGGL